jgi:hypothetical protein
MTEIIIIEMQKAGATIEELLAFAGVDPKELEED